MYTICYWVSALHRNQKYFIEENSKFHFRPISVTENGHTYLITMGPVADTGASPSLPLTLDTSNNGPNGTAATPGVNVVGGNLNGDGNNGSAPQTTNNNASSNHNKYSSHEAGSPTDQSSLTVLQPSGTGGYSSMLPSFSHYATGKFFGYFFFLFGGDYCSYNHTFLAHNFSFNF